MRRDIKQCLQRGDVECIVCVFSVYCQRAKLGGVLEKGSKGYNLALLYLVSLYPVSGLQVRHRSGVVVTGFWVAIKLVKELATLYLKEDNKASDFRF